jgi:hypothetical protein
MTILQFPTRNERILALGVMESMTFMAGHAPQPARSRAWATLLAYGLLLACVCGVLAMLA